MRRVASCLLAAVGVLALGCATRPVELDRVREDYDRMAADRRIQAQAGVELHDAQVAVERAEQKWQVDGDYDEAVHLAYLAGRRVELASLAADRRDLSSEIEAMPQRTVARLLGSLEPTQAAASMRDVDHRVQLSAGAEGDLKRLLDALDASPDARGVVTLADVLFGFDSAKLQGAEVGLDLLAAFLVAHPGRSILVEGHTDDTGVLEYNFDLSRRRAESVKTKLVEDGVPKRRVLTVGYGPVYPLDNNASAAGRARNRRVEIVVLGRGE